MIGISGSLIWSETLIELIFNPCGEFRRSPECPLCLIHSPHLHVGAPGIFSDLLKSVQMLKREWCTESNGKLPHLSIPSETATLVPEFAVKNLPLDRTATLVPEFSVEDLPLGRTTTLVPALSMKGLPLGRSATLVPALAVKDLPLGKTAALVLEFSVEDLPLGRTRTLVPSLAMKDLPLGRTLDDDDDDVLSYAFRDFRL